MGCVSSSALGTSSKKRYKKSASKETDHAAIDKKKDKKKQKLSKNAPEASPSKTQLRISHAGDYNGYGPGELPRNVSNLSVLGDENDESLSPSESDGYFTVRRRRGSSNVQKIIVFLLFRFLLFFLISSQ